MEKRLPPLNWLRAFEAAARHLSFTGAAQELNITQSAVSQQIKSLESFLGRPLFIRRARSLELTETARAYLPTLDAAFRLLFEGTQSLLVPRHNQVLELHANLAFTILWLTPRLPRFYALHPWVRLNISTTIWTSEQITPHASVEIRFGDGRWGGGTGEMLGKNFSYPLCAPALAARLKGPVDLLDERLLDVSGIVGGWESWLQVAGVKPARPPLIDRSTTYVVTFALARQGLGVSLGHDMIAQGDLEGGTLVKPFDVTLPMRESYYLLPPQGRSTNEAVKVFRDWILSEFGE